MQAIRSVLVVAASVASATHAWADSNDTKRADALASALTGKPPYTVETTPGGARYFVEPPGPCSCPGVFVAVCVKAFDTTFERAKGFEAAAAKAPSVRCLPGGGCAPAYHVVVVECAIDDELAALGFYNGAVQPPSGSKGGPLFQNTRPTPKQLEQALTTWAGGGYATSFDSKTAATYADVAVEIWPTLDASRRGLFFEGLLHLDSKRAAALLDKQRGLTSNDDLMNDVANSLGTLRSADPNARDLALKLAPKASDDVTRSIFVLAASTHGATLAQLGTLRNSTRRGDARRAWVAAMTKANGKTETKLFVSWFARPRADDALELVRLFRHVARADLLSAVVPWFDRNEVVAAIEGGSTISGSISTSYTFADVATSLVLELEPSLVSATAKPHALPYSATVRSAVKASLSAKRAP